MVYSTYKYTVQSLCKYIVLLPRWLRGKGSACNVGDAGSIPGSGRSPEEGNGYPLQYSSLENSVDRGAWWATVHGPWGRKESDTTERLSMSMKYI